MLAHLAVVAASCYPNCHPAGTNPDAVQQSGNAALGAAAILIVVMLLLFGRGKAR